MLCCWGESPLPLSIVRYEVLVLFDLIVAGVCKVRGFISCQSELLEKSLNDLLESMSMGIYTSRLLPSRSEC